MKLSDLVSEDHLTNICNPFRSIAFKELAEFRERLDRALERYALEHSKLKVWNEAQWRAREAAVSLGRQKWFQASTHLYKLSEHLNDPEDWAQFAGGFDPSFNQK